MEGLVDTRAISKPAVFDNDERHWADWKFKLVNFMALIDDTYVDLLAAAEEHEEPIPMQASLPKQTLARSLYAVLASTLCERSLRVIQIVRERNGFEAWRKLCELNEPRSAGRKYAIFQEIMQWDFGDESKFEDTWAEWEHQVDLYEQLARKTVDSDFKISVVIRGAPEVIRNHLQVNSAAMNGDYDQMKTILLAFVRSRRS